MEEQGLKKIYSFVSTIIYLMMAMNIYMLYFSHNYNKFPIGLRLNETIAKIKIFSDVYYNHSVVFLSTFAIAILNKNRKSLNFDYTKHFTLPMLIGVSLFLGSIIIVFRLSWVYAYVPYIITYLLGNMMIEGAINNLSKNIWERGKKDRWNIEQESFSQNEELIEGMDIFNVPLLYYYRKKVRNGWMNINPFRGVMVIGVPGSGKSESIIVPFIKQFLAKGYAMLIYDFKFPDLAAIAYYHYLLNHQEGKPLEKHKFHVLNIDNVEYSRRCNPLDIKYIKTLADASESADAILSALMKVSKEGDGGSSQFFNQSAKNFTAACIYFLSQYKKGIYCTLPHLMTFLSTEDYQEIFDTLFTHNELRILLAPYKSAYKNEAMEQLEGQIGTVRVNISKIASKESFWVFSGNDFDLKISSIENPSIVVMANSPQTQQINSAFYASVLMRASREMNSKGNMHSAIVIDELPTIFFHKLDNLIATARSNKVATILGLQELTQFKQLYGDEAAKTISSILGSVISGSVRDKTTLDWLSTLAGKIKQETTGISVNNSTTSVNLNERMDQLLPPQKIASLNAGEVMAVVAKPNPANLGDFEPNIHHGRVVLDMEKLKKEKEMYLETPKYYSFRDDEHKNKILAENFDSIFDDINNMIKDVAIDRVKEQA